MPGHIEIGASVHWGTPQNVLTPLYDFFEGPPDLDPCANNIHSIVGAKHNFTLPLVDGLKAPWDVAGKGTKVYDNPPFGRCHLRDDLQVVFSAQEWTAGRKKWKSLVDTCQAAGVTAKDLGGALNDVGELLVSDTYAARFHSATIADWSLKNRMERNERGVECVQLLPAAVDTFQWQADDGIIECADAVCLVKGRLKFLGSVKGPAPMACAVVYWGDRVDRFESCFTKLGKILFLGGKR